MLKQYDELVQEVLEDIFVITKSEDEKLNQVIKKYFSAGGKRVRVLLLLICSKLGDFNNNKKNIIRMASIVEIIHTASLIHDDIIDKAETRRGNIKSYQSKSSKTTYRACSRSTLWSRNIWNNLYKEINKHKLF